MPMRRPTETSIVLSALLTEATTARYILPSLIGLCESSSSTESRKEAMPSFDLKATCGPLKPLLLSYALSPDSTALFAALWQVTFIVVYIARPPLYKRSYPYFSSAYLLTCSVKNGPAQSVSFLLGLRISFFLM